MTMKLSDAMRLGSMMKPQCFNDYEGPIDDGDTVGTCAIGAAIDAVGLLGAFDDEAKVFPILGQSVNVRCPAEECEELDGTLGSLIAHLNDEHEWTREAIADWVSTVEPAETTSAEISTSDKRGGLEALGSPVLATRGV